MNSPRHQPPYPLPLPSAKRRCSCLARLARAVLPQFVLLVAYTLWANWLPPAEADRRPRPHPNAFDPCVAAATRLAPLTGSRDVTRMPLARVRPVISRRKRALDAIRSSFELPYMTPAIHDAIDKTPYFAGFREAGRDFAAEGRLSLADGKAAEAIDRSLDAVEFGSRLGWGGVTGHGILELDVMAPGIAEAERCVPRLSGPDARRAGARLERIRAGMCGVEEVLRGDRLVMLTTIREVARNRMGIDRNPDGSAVGLGPLYPKRWMYMATDQMFQDLLREAAKPYPTRLTVPVPTEPLSKGIYPFYPLAMLRFTCADACLRLLQSELALQEYHCQHGLYPSALSEIDGRLAGAATLDPFDERPLIYRRRKTGYLLYSVGPNERDDGGAPLPSGPLRTQLSGDLVASRLAGWP